MKTDSILKRLRWVMVFVILFDFANTLLGQPSTYWRYPETVNEGDRFIRAIALHGWMPFVLFMLLYTAGAFVFVSWVRRRIALIGLFSFIFCDFYGGASWLDRHWRFGAAGFIIYGIVLAVVLVLVIVPTPSPSYPAASSPRSSPQIFAPKNHHPIDEAG